MGTASRSPRRGSIGITGGNGTLLQTDNTSGPDGTLKAQWVLGTRASDVQRLQVDVHLGGGHAPVAQVTAAAVPVEVATLTLRAETTEVRLGAIAQLQAQATDPFGNHFVPKDLRFVSLDTTLSADSMGVVVAHRRGFARAIATAGGLTDTALVHAIQVVAAIRLDHDTLRFHSLGQAQTLGVALIDDRGLPVADSLPAVAPSDSTVVALQPANPLVIKSKSNGVASVTLSTATASASAVVVVRQHTASLAFTVPSFAFDALNDTTRAGLIALDSLGVPVQSPRITFSSSDTAVALIDSTGLLRARGNGFATIQAQSLSGVAATVVAVVAQRVTRVAVARDTLAFAALHAMLPTGAVALDRLGSPVATATLTYATDNNSIATVGTDGRIEALANGTTRVITAHAADSAVVVVRVQQRPVRVVMASDTVRFVALKETNVVLAVAVDSLGYRVSGQLSGLTVADPSVVQLVDSVTLRALGNGTTKAGFTVAGVAAQAWVVVRQVAATMQVGIDSGKPIVSLPQDSLIPVSCQVWDRNAQPMVVDPTVAPSSGNRWIGGACDSLRIRRSGFDTLRFSIDTVTVSTPVVLVVRPLVSSTTGDFLIADSFPSATSPWAPSARLVQGGVEVYVALGDISYVPRTSLHRFISSDGVHFIYDGVVLDHGADSCALNGSGIENMAIVPRRDSTGWRMYYAAGSNDCYGWQVFSAVSTDGRTWVEEPGVRLSNGGPVPPDLPSTPPWPVGEGIVVDQLPSGDWRMIVGSYEHVLPSTDTWQIAEWRSSDQLTWSYVRTVLTTRDMPPEAQGSVYSPAIGQIAPGLWRMTFTADNRGSGQPFQSALWSAVSVDEVHWQLEGKLMGGSGTNLFYSALAGDRLVFIRQDPGQPFRVGIATLVMP